MSRRPTVAQWGIGLCCYTFALLGGGALALSLFLLGLDSWHPPPWGTPTLSVSIDLGWLLLFTLQHSGMARQTFSAWWQQHFYPPLERALYAGVSGLLLLGLVTTWQPLPGEPLWHGPWWLSAAALLGASGIALINLRFDHLGLFGLRQLREAGQMPTPDRLLIVGPYRLVRHPMMSCLLVVLWGHPVMTPTLALLSGGLTLYIGLGLYFEERDLLQRFGPAYATYQGQVPILIPWRGLARSAQFPCVGEYPQR